VRRVSLRTSMLSLMVAVVAASPLVGVGISPADAVRSITAPSNLVHNPDANVDLSGWSVSSDAGVFRMARVGASSNPAGTSTAVDLQRGSGTGSWAVALVALNAPATAFRVGQAYRMQTWVRDVDATGRSVGILLGNAAYRHRPTDASAYLGLSDSGWHRVVRTFVCTALGSADTSVYLALPPSGSVHLQVTAVSVQALTAPRPRYVTGAPTRVVPFAGSDGGAPDSSVWNYETGGNGWGNNELETYTNSRANSATDGTGHLVITARRETLKGADGITRSYTSSRLTTKGKLALQPGTYVEAPIQAPVGPGVWPAFWTLGSNISQVGWPASGEIDILEGQGSLPSVSHSAVHNGRSTNLKSDFPYGWGEPGASVDLGHPLDTTTHLYGVYFDGNTVRFYIDRHEHLALWAADAVASGRDWPFDGPQYMLLNVAVAASTPSTTVFPRKMTVGAVSIWQGGIPFATPEGGSMLTVATTPQDRDGSGEFTPATPNT
jgi:beta-glucanase (GH16 family)